MDIFYYIKKRQLSFLVDFPGVKAAQPKTLPAKFLYVERDSELFEEIRNLDEYYPTSTEIDKE